ncbi:hypothetical protein NOLU111490_18350 [Novosphingobium lubricantis]|jgi:hypothetical protein
MSLNYFHSLRRFILWLRIVILRRIFGMDIHKSVELSLSAKLDMTFPAGVHVGAHSYVAYAAYVLAHDRTRGLYLHTRCPSSEHLAQLAA